MARNIFSAKNKIIIFTLTILFCSFNFAKAASVIIDDGITASTASADNNSVIFSGISSGILNHDTGSLIDINDINADNDGVGTLRIANTSTLTVSGNIGSASKRIDTITFLSQTILGVHGSIYTKNGINTSLNSQGDLNVFGNGTVISSKIGESDKRLALILVEPSVSATFSDGDIFSDRFTIGIGSSATINGSGTNNLGILNVAANSTLNLNQNTSLTSSSTANTSTINIAAGKLLSGTGALSFNGTLGLGVARSDSSTPSVSSSSNITLVDGLKINFDYSNASYLKQDDSSSVIVATSPSTLSVTTTSLGTITDNSILLTQSFEKIINSGTNESLVVTHSIDNATTAKLNAGDLAATNFLLENETAADIDNARTALLRISTQAELENSLKTLQVEKNNMTQKTSFDIANAVDSVIDYHLQSLNYDQFIFGKKDQKDNEAKANHKGLWGQVFGSTSKQDNLNSAKGYDANFAGVSFGLDKVIKNNNSNSIWGGALSYAQASAKSGELSNQKVDTNFYQLSLYNYNVANNGLGFFNENSLSIAYNQYDLDRNIKIGSYNSQSKANFSGAGYGAKTGIGYNFKVGEKVIFAPLAGIRYSGLDLSDYEEKNANGLGLKVQNDYLDLITSEIGFKLIGSTGAIQSQLNVAWLHNLNVTGAQSNSTFVNGGVNEYKVQNSGVDFDADIANVGAQINFKTSPNTTMILKYDLQKSANFSSHLGSLRFNLDF